MKNYLSMIKFSHTLFAMPFAIIGLLWGFQIKAFSWERWDLIIKVALCMVFARSAAMGFNRYIDRNIDLQNERTKIREIPSGVITPSNALIFVIVNCILFIATTWFINPLCFALSPVALIVVLGYSYTKRFTALCHLVLGLGLSLAPVGAYFAVTGGVANALPVVILGFGVLCWTGGFDIIYALQDVDFDKSQNLNSIPVYLGREKALRFSEFLHFAAALCIMAFTWMIGAGWIQWIGAGFFVSMLIYQHLLVKPHDLSKVNLAFFTTNGIASVTFAFFVIMDFVVFR
ncbi:MAG: putative 4-hydroxybenzoate polyprenyltransferase [Bacteroidia bacterium]|nr:putative 4-hydroxybenzoate polyprenyltransferase [Bacteroidia bacterium]